MTAQLFNVAFALAVALLLAAWAWEVIASQVLGLRLWYVAIYRYAEGRYFRDDTVRGPRAFIRQARARAYQASLNAEMKDAGYDLSVAGSWSTALLRDSAPLYHPPLHGAVDPVT